MNAVSVFYGCLAILAEALSLNCALRDASLERLLAAASFHVHAAILAVLAARSAGVRGGREFDAVLVTALLVPLFGPALAWMMPVASDEEADASRVMLEQVERNFGRCEAYAPPRFLGDFEADLAREVNSISYKEVLQTGDLEQKRDALRKLARLGQPQHMALLARMLADEDSELRRCAYLELDAGRRPHERRIVEVVEALRSSVDDQRDEIALRAELAELNLAYACSGSLDATMRGFRLDACLEQCAIVEAQAPGHIRGTVLRARALCERRELVEAEAVLATLCDELWSHPSVRVLRARIRFDMRDFKAAKAIGFDMLRQHMDLPAWLLALCAEVDVDAARASRLPRDFASDAEVVNEHAGVTKRRTTEVLSHA